MTYTVGQAEVVVVPVADDFNRKLSEQIGPGAKAVGDQIGRQLSASIADGIRKGLNDWPTTPPRQAPELGDKTAGAFADAFKARLRSALADLPDIKLGADSSEADRKLAEIRAELKDLAGKTIGVDISDAEAVAKLDELRARLDRLNAESSSVQVKTDTAKASADLAKFQVELDKINGETATANVKVNDDGSTSQATSGMVGLWGAIGLLSPALIPVAGGAAAVGAALVSMAAVGVGAVGVLGIALASVTNAVKLLGQQQTQQAAADQQAGMQAAARAQAITAAARQEQSAQMSLADARRAAADTAVQDSQAVQSAQYALAQADQQETNAVNALVTAREAASRQLESYANAAVDTRLAEQQAVLDLETAQANYAKTMASSTATEQQRQQAALDLQKAQQHVTEAQQAAANATADNNKAQQAGVNGAPQVVSATQAVAAAKHNQQQAEQNLADAQHKAAEDQIKSQESIVRAQQGVAAAMDAMAAAQRNAAGTTNASLAATNAQVAKLDPATRAFAQYLRSDWLPIWHQVQAAATGGLLPGLQAGMDALKPEIPVFTGIIGSLSSTLGDLFKQAGKALTDPFWTNFFQMIRNDAGPLLSNVGHIIGNVVTGFAGIIQAFMPMSMQISGGIEGLTKKFSDWGQNLATSPGFHTFTDYIKSAWPTIKDVVENVATAAGHLVQGLAGISSPELALLKTFSDILAALPVPVVTAMATAFGGFKVASMIAGPVSSLSGALGKLGADSIGAGLGKVASALPIVGTALGVIGPLVPAFIDFLKGTPSVAEQAAKSVQSIASALDATNGAIDDMVRKTTAQQLQKLGLFDDAQKWGISAKTLTDAVLGNADAMAQVKAGAEKYKAAQNDLSVAQQYGAYVTSLQRDAGAKATQQTNDQLAALDKLAGGVVDQVGKQKQLTDAVYGSAAAGDAMANGSDALKKVVQIAGDHMTETWDNNTAVLSGATDAQIADLKNLGDTVIKLPDGKVVVTSDTGPARDQIDQLIKDYQNKQIAIAGGNFGPAAARVSSGGGYATGGVLPGYAPGVDSVHAMLSPGEGILVPEAVRGLGGAPAIQAINSSFSSRVPGFADGGVVGPFATYPARLSDLAMQQAEAIISQMFPTVAVAFAPGSPSNPSGNAALAQQMGAPLGWGSGAEWNAWYALGMRESGWRNTAQNPTSTAYGIAQFLDSTWATVGLQKTSDPATQITGMERYIQQRYHDPIGAWNHEVAFGWYDSGGPLPEGASLVYNGTGDTELIAPKQTFKQVMAEASGGSSGPRMVLLQLDGAATTALLKGEVTQGLEQVLNWASA